MAQTSIARDVGQLEIVMDAWTEPYWQACSEDRLLVPKCGCCGHFRWPPTPFCPECRSQAVDWVDPGAGRLFSFTILRDEQAADSEELRYHVPALVRFADAGGIKILGSLIDAPLDGIRIDAPVSLDWLQAKNTKVLVFRLTEA